MTLTLLDIALPIGLAAVFAVYRYTQRVKADPSTALPKAAADGVKGAIGLAIVTPAYKFITVSAVP
jgi:hypothetical protein